MLGTLMFILLTVFGVCLIQLLLCTLWKSKAKQSVSHESKWWTDCKTKKKKRRKRERRKGKKKDDAFGKILKSVCIVCD